MRKFYRFALCVLKVVMPLWYRIETEGTDRLPQDGGYLFVSNHRSMADPILIGMQNSKTQFCFLAKQELFQNPFIGKLLSALGAIAIDRGAGDLSPIQELAGRLKSGENALIFPEGTRSKDGKLGRFKTGAALITAQTGAPIVPVAISFDGKLRFRSTIHVRYGTPITLSCENPEDPRPSELKSIKISMTKAVSELLPIGLPDSKSET